jgi:uncharacterized protein (DUF952 family)
VEQPQSIFHITTREQWNHAALAGKYQADSLVTEGFIHCSTAAQLALSGRRYFAGQTGLVVLEIDPEKLRWELRWEESQGGGPRGRLAEHGQDGGRPPSDQSESFPHLYGPLDLDAVISVQTFSV